MNAEKKPSAILIAGVRCVQSTRYSMPRNESRDPAYLWDRLDATRAISAFVAELIP